MNAENETKTSKVGPIMKYAVKGIIFCIILVLGWFAIVRVSSPWTVVETSTVFQHPNETSPIPVNTLRVGCYNIAHGRGGKFGATNWDGGNRAEKIERVQQIGQLLRTAQLDIVVLNEVDFSSIWSGHRNQAHIIAEEAGFPYLVEQRNLNMAVPFVSIQFGNVILSKYPITDTTFLDYPNPSEFIEFFSGGYKEGVVATIVLPDDSRFQVVPIHLSVKSQSVRIASAEMLLDIHHQSSSPLLLMGDFNTRFPLGSSSEREEKRHDDAINVLLQSRLFTTISPTAPIPPEYFTFPSEHPDRLIDWVFVTDPWTVQNIQVLQTPLSDHLPVIAILTRDT